MKTSVLSRFVEHLRRDRDSTAVFVGGKSYTYGELAGLSAAVASSLDGHGVRRGDRVGVFTESSVETYASLLAILSRGACYVPLNPENPIGRNLGILADAGIQVLLYADAEDAARALCMSPGTNCRAIESRAKSALTPQLELTNQGPEDLCYLLFTSGTTGKPKGVPISYRNLAAFLDAVLKTGRYDFDRSDRFLQMFDLTFDLSVFSFLVPLSVGASFCPLPRKGIAYLEVAEILETYEISVAMMVPSVINYLKPYFNELNLPRMRYSLFAGEALYHDTLSAWARCVPCAKIENVYGPTEATIFCLRYEWQRDERPHPQGRGIVPIGVPLEGMQAFIRKEDDSQEEGELCLIGDQVTPSYWNNPAKTAESFGTTESGARFYRTGDLCRSDQEGTVLYLGRIDSQVKIDGHRIELEEIEFRAREFCGDNQVAAVANASETGHHFIILFVESDNTKTAGLAEHLQANLPPYMMPREIVAAPLFPQNSNGKIDRKVLMKEYLRNRTIGLPGGPAQGE